MHFQLQDGSASHGNKLLRLNQKSVLLNFLLRHGDRDKISQCVCPLKYLLPRLYLQTRQGAYRIEWVLLGYKRASLFFRCDRNKKGLNFSIASDIACNHNLIVKLSIQLETFTHQMAVPVPGISCCVFVTKSYIIYLILPLVKYNVKFAFIYLKIPQCLYKNPFTLSFIFWCNRYKCV